ncbi:MAG: hypothetical protein WCB53_07710 [Terriglobales bacterium]
MTHDGKLSATNEFVDAGRSFPFLRRNLALRTGTLFSLFRASIYLNVDKFSEL